MSFYLPHAPFAFPGDVAGLPLSPGCAAGTGTAVAARMAGVVLIEDPQAAGHHRRQISHSPPGRRRRCQGTGYERQASPASKATDPDMAC
jgi:hypothetical protein